MGKATKGNARKGSGKRQRFGGRMGIRVKTPGKKKYVVVMRSHTHGGKSRADAGWECGAPPGQTKTMPGRFKVPAPTKAYHRSSFGSID